ncbi:signal transducer, putative [Cryptococcus gattii WM276]|uniref:Signal transducer, putative n=1 Tax=Cryptococcus gattii serotype B (strain WM276 / ATCC MYA-4071) TaxID=367775 RepID=E6RCC3_CRYGW|nr:signal transducer, putative [Cryptococcus gattii WM276]ADV24443.1 signal transducer, putative [Cryptococcus gattii WM276]
MSSSASSLPSHLNLPSAYPHNSPKSHSRASPTNSPQTGTSPRSSPRGSTGMLDFEGVIRLHGGDLKKALESVVSERNKLLAQNTQLWKLIEKQRSQCAQFASDNDRLRQDRERANSRLTAAGLEPVGPFRKLNSSSSATGLGIRADVPQINRNHSDREDVPVIAEKEEGKGLASPVEVQPTGLLPSAILDRNLRKESQIGLPPDPSSFMPFADSPQSTSHSTHSTHSLPTPFHSAEPSPQLATSPRMAGREDGGVIPPPSSKALAASVAASSPLTQGLARPTPAAGEHSLEYIEKLPSPTPVSVSGALQSPPQLVRSETMSRSFSVSEATLVSSSTLDKAPRPSVDSSVSIPPTYDTTPRQSIDQTPQPKRQQSYSTERPQLPTLSTRPLSPSLLPHARITIPSSTIFPNSSGREVLCFIVEITIRPPNAQPITWNVAKLFSAFIDLDAKIKVTANRSRKEWKQIVAPLPESKSWKDFAPSKIDQRKTALEAYLQSLLVAPFSDKSDLCHFLSTNPVQAKRNDARKEGYLTKKGKNFGGWKTRYFVLDGPVMEYYESRGGNHLGSIVITNAQIGRQNRSVDSSDERHLRHAFLIIEAGKKGTTHRHVLCAESDTERDRWVDILVKHVDPEAMPSPQPLPTAAVVPIPTVLDAPIAPAPQSSVVPVNTTATNQNQVVPGLRRKPSQLRKQSKDVVVTSSRPLSSMAKDSKFIDAPSPSIYNNMESHLPTQNQSPVAYSPTHSFTPQAVQSPIEEHASSQPMPPHKAPGPVQSHRQPWGSDSCIVQGISPSSNVPLLTSAPTPRANGRQSVIPSRPSVSLSSHNFLNTPSTLSLGVTSPTVEKERDKKAKSRGFWGFGRSIDKVTKPVFGVPLTDSLAVANIGGLPAIVFRCIEYLEAKKAGDEEGIYRLSGSSAVIKGLKEKFDDQGDIKLLAADEHWDPHAIAGLLKTFLRDLPTSLLTRELHTQFLTVTDIVEPSERMAELARLVSELPRPNYALLRALVAHLILIIQNSARNKMTLRNIGIVFSPTLGIPAGIFSEMITNFGPIFDDEVETLDTRAEQDSRTRSAQFENADEMLGLSERHLNATNEDSQSVSSSDDQTSEYHSSDINHSNTAYVPVAGHQELAAIQKRG